MTAEQEKQLVEMCARFGLDASQAAELHVFVEKVGEDACARGEVMGASPFDGSWPTGE
jgi:hypothetical protein|nr:hypothetical protein [Neorhizobium tomejilense]